MTSILVLLPRVIENKKSEGNNLDRWYSLLRTSLRWARHHEQQGFGVAISQYDIFATLYSTPSSIVMQVQRLDLRLVSTPSTSTPVFMMI